MTDQTTAATPPITREKLEDLLNASPFQQLLGLKLETFEAGAGALTLRAVYAAHLERSSKTGQYHGGVIASLIDIAGDFALIAVLGYGVPTINVRVDYLRPAASTDLLGVARVRRAGRTIGVVDIDVTDPDGRLIALGRGCYSTKAG